MADVEMKPAEEKSEEKKTDEKADDKTDKEPVSPPSPVAEIKANIALIEKAVSTLEPRFTHRVLRSLTALRRRLDNQVLRDAIQEVYPKGSQIS
jgi:26S proteasome regulatory subunit N3